MTRTRQRDPLFHVVKRNNSKWYTNLSIRLLVILVGILIGCLVLFFAVGASPIQVLGEMFSGCFGTQSRVFRLLREMCLLLIVALALVPAFKMKFWNLGGNGQILMGNLAAIACMYFMGRAGAPDWAIWLAMIPSAILAGAVWALIPAIFKAFFNTNESLFTLMMNYIAAGLVEVFLTAVITNGSQTMPAQSSGRLPVIFNEYMLTIFVAVVALIVIWKYLAFRRHGYELEVVGESQNTAKYVGINVKVVIIRTMILSGAICGIVGLLLAGSINFSITSSADNNMGFTSIIVAWLAQFNPFAMVGTSFLVGFLTRGMAQVQTTLGISNDSLTNIILGIVYFFVISAEFILNYKINFRSDISQRLHKIFDPVSNWFKKVFTPVGNWFKKVFGPMVKRIKHMVLSIELWFNKVFKAIGRWFVNLFSHKKKENTGVSEPVADSDPQNHEEEK